MDQRWHRWYRAALALCVVCIATASLQAQNPIANPGFEDGFFNGVATDWEAWSTAGSGDWKQSTRLGRIGPGLYYNSRNPVAAAVALSPKTILLMDQVHFAASALKISLPDALLVGRVWVDDRDQEFLADPDNRGVQFADEIFSNYYSRFPDIKVWQGMNEPGLNDVENVRKVARFEKAFAQRLHERGLKSCAFNIAVGNPGDMNNMLLQEVVDCLAVADYVGYHSYGGPQYQLMMNATERPWYSLRWRYYKSMYDQHGYRMPPVIYTECTTWSGWKGVFSAGQIRDDLNSFEAETRKDPWSVGMCIFLCGSIGWDGWEIANEPTIYNECGSYNRDHPADAHAGLYSQQFGEANGGFTGGVRQVVNVDARADYQLDHWMKYETYGYPTAIDYRVGYDLTGQTSDPAASTIVWSANLMQSPRRETDWWYSHNLSFRSTGLQVSLWFKGGQPAGQSPWRIMLDEVKLTRTGGPYYAKGDFDRDGDVDQADFGSLQACLDTNGAVSAPCVSLSLDADSDVDQDDLVVFLSCFGGANVPPNPACEP